MEDGYQLNLGNEGIDKALRAEGEISMNKLEKTAAMEARVKDSWDDWKPGMTVKEWAERNGHGDKCVLYAEPNAKSGFPGRPFLYIVKQKDGTDCNIIEGDNIFEDCGDDEILNYLFHALDLEEMDEDTKEDEGAAL